MDHSLLVTSRIYLVVEMAARRVGVAMVSTMRGGWVPVAGGGGRHGVLRLAVWTDKGAYFF